MNRRCKIQLAILFTILGTIIGSAQLNAFRNRFSGVCDWFIVPKYNENYQEYYEVTVPQLLDHSTLRGKFDQRVYVGFRDLNAPTILVIDGYSIDYVSEPGYFNELAKELKANIVVVEHRFFGRSVPDSLDWQYLTAQQAAGDCHLIKSMLEKVLTGKWLSMGISKGGQAALAYNIYYPGEVRASVVYGTALRWNRTAFADTILSGLSETSCGQRINKFQDYLFRHKNALLPYLAEFAAQKKLDFAPLGEEAVLDYMLLELPFLFWQNGNKCDDIPDTASAFAELATYLTRVVPPWYYSAASRRQLEPAFFMFYHEFGYYEYNVQPFIRYLSQTGYTNAYFAPRNTVIQFDNSFHKAVAGFINSDSSECTFFVYGENDPWALQTTAVKNVFVVPGGSHRSRVADLPHDQQAEVYRKILTCINE